MWGLCIAIFAVFLPTDGALGGITAHSMLTRDGRRMVSRMEGTNTVYELVPTNNLPSDLPPVREWRLYGLKATHTDIGLHNSPYIQRHGTVKCIDEAARLIDRDTRKDDDPAAYRYVFDADELADTFLELPGFGKGTVFLNGIALGRFWEIGPQKRLYIPAPLLRKGANELLIIETEGKHGSAVLCDEPSI
jgi:hypothetical protein